MKISWPALDKCSLEAVTVSRPIIVYIFRRCAMSGEVANATRSVGRDAPTAFAPLPPLSCCLCAGERVTIRRCRVAAAAASIVLTRNVGCSTGTTLLCFDCFSDPTKATRGLWFYQRHFSTTPDIARTSLKYPTCLCTLSPPCCCFMLT